MAESVYGKKIVVEPWIDLYFDETVRLDIDHPSGDRLLSPDQALKLIKELYDALPASVRTGLVVHEGLNVSIGPLKSTISKKQVEILQEAASRPEWADAPFLEATSCQGGKLVRFVRVTTDHDTFVSDFGGFYTVTELSDNFTDIRKA